MEVGVPTVSKTTPKTSPIFVVFNGLITATEGKNIRNKIKGIIALHNGPITILFRIISGANFAYPSTIHPLNVLNFTTIDNT